MHSLGVSLGFSLGFPPEQPNLWITMHCIPTAMNIKWISAIFLTVSGHILPEKAYCIPLLWISIINMFCSCCRLTLRPVPMPWPSVEEGVEPASWGHKRMPTHSAAPSVRRSVDTARHLCHMTNSRTTMHHVPPTQWRVTTAKRPSHREHR